MRILHPSAVAALESGRFARRHLLAVDMPDGVVGFWDDVYDITIESQLYRGAAGRFTLSPVHSIADQSVRNLDVTFSGLDTEVANLIEAEPWHQRAVTVRIAIMAVDAPQTLYVMGWFTGFVDQMIRRERVGGTAELVFRCEPIARELGRRGARTRSDADQRQLDPDDGFFKHAVNSSNVPIEWGRRPPPKQKRPKLFGIF